MIYEMWNYSHPFQEPTVEKTTIDIQYDEGMEIWRFHHPERQIEH